MTIHWGDSTSQTSAATSVAGAATTRKWVRWYTNSGTPTITDDYGISSITDHGNGYYGINFDSNWSNANYCAVGFTDREDGAGGWAVAMTLGPSSHDPPFSTSQAKVIQGWPGNDHHYDGDCCNVAFFSN